MELPEGPCGPGQHSWKQASIKTFHFHSIPSVSKLYVQRTAAPSLAAWWRYGGPQSLRVAFPHVSGCIRVIKYHKTLEFHSMQKQPLEHVFFWGLQYLRRPPGGALPAPSWLGNRALGLGGHWQRSAALQRAERASLKGGAALPFLATGGAVHEAARGRTVREVRVTSGARAPTESTYPGRRAKLLKRPRVGWQETP